MSNRRTQLPSRGGPPPTRFRGSRPVTSRRTSFADQSVVTVARSSRSSASSVVSRKDGSSGVVSLPLTLFEYGFPKAPPPLLKPTNRFPSGKASNFMNSEAGVQLRAMESEYTSVFSQFVNRSVRLAGTRLLILGSGASRVVTKYLVRGVSSVTFVDTSEDALSTLASHIASTGLEARVQTEYVCQDAWSYLREYDDEPYDTVVATKCVGLILAHAPSRDEAGLMDLVTDVLAPDGSFFTDHHVAFADPPDSGKLVKDLAGQHFDLATICGRYDADKCYSWVGMSSDMLKPVTSYQIHESPSMVQCWEMFHFRLETPQPPSRSVKLLPPRLVAPAGLTLPPTSGFDKVADAMIPLNNKGVKRIPTASDLAKHDISLTRLKLDGVAGVIQLEDSVGVFVSPSRTFAFELNRVVTPGLTLAAEVVGASNHKSSVFITGVISVGSAAADPLDYKALEPLVPFLQTLSPSGVLPSTPDLVRLVRGDMLEMVDAGGRAIQFPVDGLQVTTNGRAGVFIKPPNLTTVDATNADVDKLFSRASSALGFKVPFTPVHAKGDGVWEFAHAANSTAWIPVRRREDKTRSDTLGAVIHTFSAYQASMTHATGSTVEQMIKILTA
nr:methyltransferase [Cladosporium ramotenellum polymycovirus 1]WEW73478.1 methyltransferase [Cladosporium ramotenellum polymycovirus 1]